ncbi:MAG: SH3 domain-containing protein [Proteobacteria bacterium]|nr:SH3 domain-containing protein [Pseudomonadota bacterium]
MSFFDKMVEKVSDATGIEAPEVKPAKTEEEVESFDFTQCFELEKPAVAHVTCDVLNVRSDASTDNARIGQLKRGAEISVLAVCENWLRIQYSGRPAYVFWAYTDYEAPELTVTASSLNVRKGPGTNHDKIGALANGTVVKVIAEENGWVKILHNKRVGYVSREYLK